MESNPDINSEWKGKLKSYRSGLRDILDSFSTIKAEENKIEVIEKLLNAKDRVLNPGSHAGDEPLYKQEVQDALDLVKHLESVLSE